MARVSAQAPSVWWFDFAFNQPRKLSIGSLSCRMTSAKKIVRGAGTNIAISTISNRAWLSNGQKRSERRVAEIAGLWAACESMGL